jgi:hypothetical protein
MIKTGRTKEEIQIQTGFVKSKGSRVLRKQEENSRTTVELLSNIRSILII